MKNMMRPKDQEPTSKSDKLNVIDSYIGKQIRQYRKLAGLSQEQLGQNLGVTFQQIQKYELAINRISASNLHYLAFILNVSVNSFYEGIPISLLYSDTPTDHLQNKENDFFTRRETLELLRAYYQLPDREKRRKFYYLIKSALTSSKD